MNDVLVYEEECPCFMGGSCPTDYKHKEEITPMLAHIAAQLKYMNELTGKVAF